MGVRLCLNSYERNSLLIVTCGCRHQSRGDRPWRDLTLWTLEPLPAGTWSTDTMTFQARRRVWEDKALMLRSVMAKSVSFFKDHWFASFAEPHKASLAGAVLVSCPSTGRGQSRLPCSGLPGFNGSIGVLVQDDELSYALGKQGGTRKKLERASGAVLSRFQRTIGELLVMLVTRGP